MEIVKLFCSKPSPKHKYVIPVNHKKEDNHHKNLKRATLEEVSCHQHKSPQKITCKNDRSTKQKDFS